jgi:hypothetical protein
MILVPRRQIRTQQPQGLVRIDWGNPITRGLEVAWYPGCGFGTVNGVGPHGRLGALGMTLPLDVSDRVRKGTLVSQQTRVNTNLVTYAPILGLHRESPTYTQKQFLLRGTWATTSYQSLLLGSHGTNSGNVNGALPTVGAYRQHALSWDLTGASPSVAEYLDLGAGGTFTPYGTWPWPAGLQRNVYVGHSPVGVLATYGFLFSRRLGLAELASLDENPWQIFAPHETRIFVPVSAGGGSTLNAAATGGAVAGGSASLAAQVALSGVGVSTADGSATAAVSIPLAAAGISIFGGAATAQAAVTISATGLAQAAAQAGLSASVLLAGSAAALASGNAALAAQLNALASGAAQASGTANLSGGAPGALNATGQAQADGSAVLSVNINLVAAGAAQASGTATGTASAPGALNAAGAAQAGGAATWSALITLTAAGFVQAVGAGSFTAQVPLSASGQASAGGQAGAVLVGQVHHFRLAATVARKTALQLSARRTTTLHHEVRHA